MHRIQTMQRIQIVDSHTEGEPTRVIVDGGPDLGPGSAAQRMAVLSRHHDGFRAAVACEPRGSEALVGALLAPASDGDTIGQVIFFNNVGYLGMCVHGTIGVARTLHHLGRISPGEHRLETPVGKVAFRLDGSGRVEVDNVFSYRHRAAVEVVTRDHGPVGGDIAYGGNWFFLAHECPITIGLGQIEELTAFAWDIRHSLNRLGLHGANGAEIDHIELFGPASRPDADSKNFVLCPGKAYDRSPCGTGTSAKMACLAADGLLADGVPWRQESTIGSLFEGSVRRVDDGVMPAVAGHAYITGEGSLLIDPRDPYAQGVAA